LSAFRIKSRQQPVLNIDIAFDAVALACFVRPFPAEARMVFVPNILLSAFAACCAFLLWDRRRLQRRARRRWCVDCRPRAVQRRLCKFPHPDKEQIDVFVQKDDIVIETGHENINEEARRHSGGPRRPTLREQEVLALVNTGRPNKQIAYQLSLSEMTVMVHRSQVMHKMGARSLVDLVRMADKLRVSATQGATIKIKP
jgi:DNA-binding CsgD family transcriptional regulator